jgi:hypothetical protein
MDDPSPAERPFLFLNFNQADSGRLGELELPRDYRLACRFLHCSVIDRTGALTPPFPWTVLDPIPSPAPGGASFAELCDRRGNGLVAEAIETDRSIHLWWSGGIDSTAASIAVMKAAERQGCPERVQVLLSLESVLEYPAFYLGFINRRYRMRVVQQPMARTLDARALNVTGEHGDQLFGSHLLVSHVRRGVANAGYCDLLPLVLLERLRHPLDARRAGRYLQPVLDAAPVPIVSLFDALWWLNFTLKWQEVSLRMVGMSGAEARPLYDSLRHFFRTAPFQAWALANTPGRAVEHWADYKATAKAYIRDFTGDDRYFRLKTKEDSLRNVLGAGGDERYRVFMRDDFLPVVTPVPARRPGRLRGLIQPEPAPRGRRFPEYGR